MSEITSENPEIKNDTSAAAPTSQSRANSFATLGLRIWKVFAKVWGWAAYAIGSLFLSIIVIAIIISLVSQPFNGGQASNERYLFGSGVDKVVVLSIKGVIGETGSSIFGEGVGITSELIRSELEQAKNDPAVAAVVLNINSPGGSAVISDEIFQHIERFKNNAKIPVVASFGDTAASGGYYVAAAADKIVANPASITGSIGVIMEYFNASGLLSNIGVSPEVIKSGQYKDIGSLTRETTPEERTILQSVVDEAYAQFVTRVAEGRDMERGKVAGLADGRIYTGTQAKANGLVDELGSLDKAVEVAKSLAGVKSASVVEYERGDWFSSLLGATTNLQPLSSLNRLVPSTSVTGLQYRWIP